MSIVLARPTLPDTPLTPDQYRYKFARSSLGQYDPTAVDSTATVNIPGSGNFQIDYDASGNPIGISDAGGGAVTTPGSVNWTSIINTIARGGMDIAKIVSLPSGVVVQTPGGTILRQAPGLPVPATLVGGTVGAVGTAALSSGAGLAIAAVVGLVALVMVARR